MKKKSKERTSLFLRECLCYVFVDCGEGCVCVCLKLFFLCVSNHPIERIKTKAKRPHELGHPRDTKSILVHLKVALFDLPPNRKRGKRKANKTANTNNKKRGKTSYKSNGISS